MLRVTKYPQSCVVVQQPGGGRLLIDPGNVAMDAVTFDAFGAVDAVLFTHRHPDHFDDRALAAVRERRVPVYANADVCRRVDGDCVEVVDGVAIDIAGVTVVPHDLPHVTMVNGSAGPPNTGYLLDGRLLHPGDAVDAGDLRAPALAVPIVGPSVSFRDAYVMIERTGAAVAVPIHYDTFPSDPHMFAGFCDVADVVVLGDGESTEL